MIGYLGIFSNEYDDQGLCRWLELVRVVVLVVVVGEYEDTRWWWFDDDDDDDEIIKKEDEVYGGKDQNTLYVDIMCIHLTSVSVSR